MERTARGPPPPGSRSTGCPLAPTDSTTRSTRSTIFSPAPKEQSWRARPAFSNVWKQATFGRDAGSPMYKPVVDDGISVRFAEQRGDFDSPAGEWAEPRIGYLQHGNDPIVWIGPSVIWSKPDWLTDGERSPMLSDDMVWIPGVTAFQGVIDLILSQGVPEGRATSTATLRSTASKRSPATQGSPTTRETASPR
nr:alpha/beta-hydrolase family protein [Demequina litorisediminis]